MEVEEILSQVKRNTNNLKWKDIEFLCSKRNWPIKDSKKGYKVYINHSVWTVHLEHRTSNELKWGIIKELKKILIKEKIL